jgi:hypothetical protein
VSLAAINSQTKRRKNFQARDKFVRGTGDPGSRVPHERVSPLYVRQEGYGR